MRVNIIKATLQLTPEQEKFWPAVENAIRQRAKSRQARLASLEQTVGERTDRGAPRDLRDQAEQRRIESDEDTAD